MILITASCARDIDVNKPVNLIWDKAEKKTGNIIVFLPGLYNTAEIFIKEEFFTMARSAGIKADMVAASIDIQHLLQENMIERIEKDIYQVIKNKGYKNIWFVGISLGGLNSLLFYQKYYNELCGAVVLGPYLADEELTEELQSAGDIRNWKPKLKKDSEMIDQKIQTLWQWLQKMSFKKKLNNIYLGYGDDDKYIDSIKLFHKILNNKKVIIVDGKHNWITGRKIWKQQLLSRGKTGLFKPCH